MRLVHRIVAGPAAALLLAAAGAVTTLGTAPAQAAVVAVPGSGDRIEVLLSAQETRLGAWGQGVGAHVCSAYVEPASANTAITVEHASCEALVDACATVAHAVGGLALVTFYADGRTCANTPMLAQPTDGLV
jgi:hypothetical protein